MARPTSLIAALAAIVPNVMICATFERPYFSGDVFDHVAAPPHAEVDIDIGHRHALRIEKALEQQVILQRIDVRNLQRVADQASRRRTASRTHGNSLRSRITDKVPDDQEISGVAHLLDHADFIRQARFVFRQRFAQLAGLGARFQNRHAPRKTFPHDGFKIAVDRMAFGNLKIREMNFGRLRS